MSAFGVVARLTVLAMASFVATDAGADQQGSAGKVAEAVQYSGVMLCADCSGIQTDLTLYRDAKGGPTTYKMSETYEGKGVPPRKTSGTWVIVRGDAKDPSATVYQLRPDGSRARTNFLRVNEDELSLLDGSMTELPPSLPHTLKRVGAAPGAKVLSEETSHEASLKVGEMVTVMLAANPSTGFSWTVAPVADEVLTQVSMVFRPRSGGGVVGAGGLDQWTFKAVKVGKQTLTFEYRRPWEKDVAAAKTAVYSVVVQ